MRTTRQTRASKPQPKMVRCSECAICTRDTDGPSFNLITKEYFMGTCPKGHADGRVFIDPETGQAFGKVFMDKARVCTDIVNK